MKYNITVKGAQVTLEHDDLGDVINIDDMTRIDTSNLFGEAVTISALTNRWGLMKSDLEADLADIKKELKYFEAKFKARKRYQALSDSGFFLMETGDVDSKGDKVMVRVKVSEASLNTSFETDREWQTLYSKRIKAEADLGSLASVYWSMQDKARKLNGFVGGTTPEDFEAELIEGKLNGIQVVKTKDSSKRAKKAASLG